MENKQNSSKTDSIFFKNQQRKIKKKYLKQVKTNPTHPLPQQHSLESNTTPKSV